jgi:hypothetical protein
MLRLLAPDDATILHGAADSGYSNEIGFRLQRLARASPTQVSSLRIRDVLFELHTSPQGSSYQGGTTAKKMQIQANRVREIVIGGNA